MNHPLFEIVTTSLGATSIRNKALNETMHNPVGPWAEANSLYIEQSRLGERLREANTEELVVFDVGLGAAANALAALHCARGVGDGARPMRLISFERELELLRYALKHGEKFDHFRDYMATVERLLAHGSVMDGKVAWELRHGDFVELIAEEKFKPHIIFYDPYSSKVNADMWSVECFKMLRSRAREQKEGGTSWYNYSQATPVRVTLLKAGFFVGVGRASGPKEETTIASTVLESLESPLGKSWFERWSRSHLKSLDDLDFLKNHIQFV